MGVSRVPQPPSQGSPPALPPAYLKVAVQTGRRKAKGATHACPLHGPMVPQDAEGGPGPKGQRRGLAHWARQDQCPEPERDRGWVPKAQPAGGSPSTLRVPDGPSDRSVPLLCPADSTARPSGACLPPLARKTEQHQASGQDRNHVAACTEPTVGGGEAGGAGEPLCAWRLPSESRGLLSRGD